MNTAITRISAITYFLSLSLYLWLSSNASSDLDPVIVNYLQWWYSQPLSDFEFLLAKFSMGVLFLSGFFSVALIFIKRWAALGFLSSVGYLFIVELLMPHYFPLSRLEATLESISAISFGSVLVIFLLESKLQTFKV
jgi:hypothetical protein